MPDNPKPRKVAGCEGCAGPSPCPWHSAPASSTPPHQDFPSVRSKSDAMAQKADQDEFVASITKRWPRNPTALKRMIKNAYRAGFARGQRWARRDAPAQPRNLDDICDECGNRLGEHYDGSCPTGDVLRGPHPTLRFRKREAQPEPGKEQKP
jgi:hypothetical protein